MIYNGAQIAKYDFEESLLKISIGFTINPTSEGKLWATFASARAQLRQPTLQGQVMASSLSDSNL